MKKIRIDSPGSYEKLQIVEETSPAPKAGEVLVAVKFSGVNYADCLVRWGVYESAKKYVGWPITPGFEVSGIIKALGPGAKKFKIGDEVFGFTLFNGYSSEICLDENHMMPLPKGFSMAQGAAFPAVYMTAYYSLFQIVHLPRGSNVLIHSAAGGMGTALVQLCKLHGFTVAGVVGSSGKISYLRNLKADKIYDKSTKGFKWEQIRRDFPAGFDAVFDANGYSTLKISYDLVRPTGKLMIYGAHSLLPKQGGRINYLKAALGILRTPRFNPMSMVTGNKSIICFNVSFLFGDKPLIRENLESLTQLANSGELHPPYVNIFPFNEVARAHQFIESGTSTGKIVLQHS